MDLPERRTRFHAYLTEDFPKVYNYLRRLVRQSETAEDLAQDAFLKAWQAFERFDRQKPFLPWVLQIARHTALDYFRKHREFANPDILAVQTDRTASPEQNLLDLEKARRLEFALQQLPEAQRTAVFLYYQEEINVSGLAMVLKTTKASVMSLLHRARQRLKKTLTSGEGT